MTVIEAAFILPEFGPPMKLHTPSTKIRMVDVVIYEPFIQEAIAEINPHDWWKRCIA